ncbi:hypothetical protein ABZ612_34850 [Streptomyces avermitilis]|uniref:hypothetical protein n=1 Tax=Streptomyces avermitilis TaxID=33903 RepID=UPI00340D0654
MMGRPAPQALASSAFRDDEKCFSYGGYQLLDDIMVPLFGEPYRWPADCIGRPASRKPSEWRFIFPLGDPLINLQLREYCFALLNPSHPVLRQSLIFLPAVPLSVATIRPSMAEIRKIMDWGREQGLPDDLGLWDPEDWHEEIAHKASQVEGVKTVAFHVTAIRRLRQLAQVLTGISAFDDPWGDEPASTVAAKAYDEETPSRDTLATPAIPPETWWPLLRGAWTYIHTFAPDIVRWRDHFAQQREAPAGQPRSTKARPVRPHETDALLETWLRTPGNAVPCPRSGLLQRCGRHPDVDRTEQDGHQRQNHEHLRRQPERPAPQAARHRSGRDRRGTRRDPHGDRGPRQGPRRAPLHRTGHQYRRHPTGAGRRRTTVACQPEHRGAGVRDRRARGGRGADLGYGRPPDLGPTPPDVHRQRNNKRFDRRNRTGAARARLVSQAVADGRGIPVDSDLWSGWRAYPLQCPDAAHIPGEDGTSAPWRTHISAIEVAFELHMLRAAIYVFVAAYSLMRDSEVQEIQRDAIRTHFGSPAVRSRKTKLDPTRPELYWWITEPVAEALAVLERLSWHPTHLFAALRPPTGKQTHTEPGISSDAEIDFFINGVNTVAHRHGLAKIPPSHVRSHMFRKTMSQLAGREPDSEVALGLQLKHAARRALANRTTQAYAQMDASWAKEFDTELQQAAARNLVDLLRGRRQGERVAVGPGAARLHAGLDKVIDTINNRPQLRAQIADERVEEALLADEFPNLHLGTINHCMFDAPQAECQDELPEDQRGLAPLLGACQPARCRNSTITRAHAPYGVAEEDDLTVRSQDPRLSPPRREAVIVRLADVQRITRALEEEGRA